MPTGEPGKIKTVRALAQLCARFKRGGRKVVLCHGIFDLMHPGHIKHFQAARRAGDALFVTITPDRHVNKGPGRPVFTQNLRAETIASLETVDYVAVNEWPTAVETIKAIKPDIYVKGADYADAAGDITGGIARERAAVESCGGRLHITDEIAFSSTELLNRFFGVFSEETKRFLDSFRLKYSARDVSAAINGLAGLKVLVVGDAIVDEYHYCSGLGKPPKDNIISAKFVSGEKFPGGALACANHVAGFCGRVDLLTCLGARDSREQYIRGRLRPNIRPRFFYRPDACTVVKRRYVDAVFLTKLFEVEFLEDKPLPSALSGKVLKWLAKNIGNYDLALVSDFGHGFISGDAAKALSKAKFLAVNAQTNSANAGFNLITKYARADYVCIDEPEIRLAARDRHGDIRDVIRNVCAAVKCPRVSVTRGHLGAITYDAKKGFFETPGFADKIVDRVGAGDSYLSITAPLAAAGRPADLLGFVGNAMAAIKVGIVCNRAPVEPVPLHKFIATLLK
ncbi:MAG: PfkB family carbohydrate kinase [Elusimicrobiales bacterium]|nr:PfkB family carbohydrate kinase [Elusimicrobiales bacterium]